MNLLLELLKFFIYSSIIVLISKYVLVVVLRKLGEALNLSPKTIGNIAGAATSVPEFLTVSFSAMAGLMDTSTYNILSSNIINLVQYLFTIFINKNQNKLQNKALKIDLAIVVATILIPIAILATHIEFNLALVPAFILLLILSYYLNANAHKLYLKKSDKELANEIIEEKKWISGKKGKVIKYVFYLIAAGIGLYIVGTFLTSTLTNLSNIFKLPQFILGMALGFITSIPELITFFESQKHYNIQENKELGVIEATNNLLTSNVANLFVIQTFGVILFAIFS